MERTTNDKEILMNDLQEMKSGEIEQMFLITYYSLISYFKSLLTFGARSSVTKDNLNVIREMFRITRIERNMLNYMMAHIDEFDIETALGVVGSLDRLNDRTVIYYYDVINEIEDAVEMNEERRGLRPRQDFDSLIQTNMYAKEIVALAESKDSIREFLCFGKSFWNFIDSREVVIDTEIEEAEVNAIRDSENRIVDLRITIPKVKDLESALLCLKLYRKAYDYYRTMLNQGRKENTGDYSWTQEKYQEHLVKKSKELLKIKM